ncbi:MAG: ABC transporter ATP-binding protein [Pseudomonadota bacterium]
MTLGSETAIAVTGLSKRFGDKTVVKDFDITVPKGAIYGFLGPNGSGKTTTIRMLCGLLTADSGEGLCLGLDVMQDHAAIKKRVGYMTQKFSLYGDLTIRENLTFFARLHGRKPLKSVVADVLVEYDLTARADQLAGALSGGWKQRLALAACTLNNPELLLLDEPTAGVDPKARRDFWDRIRAMSRRGVTTLVSTHYMDEAVQCDNIAFIAYGTKLIDAPSGALASKVGLATFRAKGTGLAKLYDDLEGLPGVEQRARFGDAIHVSGRDRTVLSQSVSQLERQPGIDWEEVDTGLEETFIYLMTGSQDNFQ